MPGLRARPRPALGLEAAVRGTNNPSAPVAGIELDNACSDIFKSTPLKTIGSGRNSSLPASWSCPSADARVQKHVRSSEILLQRLPARRLLHQYRQKIRRGSLLRISRVFGAGALPACPEASCEYGQSDSGFLHVDQVHFLPILPC